MNPSTKTQRLTKERPANIERAYALLKENEAFLEAVIDSLPVALFAKDASDGFRFILWNKKQEQITTIPKEKALGKTDYDLFSGESADYFREVDEAVLRRGKMINVPEEIIATDKLGDIWLHTVKVPVKDPNGQGTVIVGISEDITEKVKSKEQLKRLNENLSQANEELKNTQMQLIQAEKMESIGRLAAGVAHEVKNPLALLLMGVEYLSSGVDREDENVPEILAEMREAINRADSIIRGLVDFSSQRQLALVKTDIRSTIEQVLLLVRHEITRNSIQVQVDMEEELPAIMADSAKLEQVFINLMMNAIHAMEEVPKGRLEVRTYTEYLTDIERDEGARTADHLRMGDLVVVVEILDNGGGIPEEHLQKVFDPFFTTKATGVGTGLGLSVVRKIVELHKGAVDITNRPEGGVRVKIRFKVPRRKAEAIDTAQATEA